MFMTYLFEEDFFIWKSFFIIEHFLKDKTKEKCYKRIMIFLMIVFTFKIKYFFKILLNIIQYFFYFFF